ncbi:MAG: type II toxin-antitoxin system RelE/ParE family toxin [Melioribacteraceae bacterium]
MLIVRKKAEEDTQQAYDWYTSAEQKLGIQFINEVERMFEMIETNPEMYGKVFVDLRRALCKRFPYAIYFTMSKNNVIIIGVLHQRRNPIKWQMRSV